MGEFILGVADVQSDYRIIDLINEVKYDLSIAHGEWHISFWILVGSQSARPQQTAKQQYFAPTDYPV